MSALATLAKVGDHVLVDTCEGFGGPGVVVEVDGRRQHARCKVRLDGGTQSDFWAHDFEIVEFIHPDGRYDSRNDTAKHVGLVRAFLGKMIADLAERSEVHDRSKFASPEVEVFDEFTPKLAGSTYGSDEYRAFLDAMKPALDHHYAANDHHPEHFDPPDDPAIHHLEGVLSALDEGPGSTALHDAARVVEREIEWRSGRARSMNLVQLIEMLCDWLAATKRHDDGNIRRSIEINQKRFGYSDELKQIFLNTLPLIEGGSSS